MSLGKGKRYFVLGLKHSSIARQVLTTTVVCGSLLAVVFSIVHAYTDYRKNVILADFNLENVGRFCISEIEREVNSDDPAKVKTVLERIVNLSGLSSIEIREGIEKRSLFSFGEKDKREIIRKVFSLGLRNGSGELNSRAILIVRKDISRLQYKAWAQGFYDFLFMMFFVAAVSTGLFLLLRNNFVHTLLSLIEYADNFNFDKEYHPLLLNKRFSLSSRPDEFDLLAKAMNAMRERFVQNLCSKNEAETEQAKAQALLVSLLDSIPDLIFYKDVNGVYLGCNTAFEKFCGRTKKEIVGQTDLELFPRHLAEYFRSKDNEMLNLGGPRSNEEWVTYPDGKRVLLETTKTTYLDEHDNVIGLIGISRDITGRKTIENEWKEAQERFEKAFDASPMMIMVLDLASERLIDVNLRYIEKTGYTKTQLLSSKLADFVFRGEGDDVGKFLKVVATDVDEIPVMIRTKSEDKIDCLLAGRKVTFSERPCLLIFLDDISLRKQAEETMRRSMKMDAVGQVTGGIAHDFNNILGIIIGNLDYIKRFCTTEELILQRVEAVAKASGRAAMLTRQLLDFSRQQAGNCEPTDINKIIRGMDNLIERSVTPEVEVTTELYPELWIVDIDRGDFENVLLNLVINARDAMPKGGKLHITTCNTVLDENYILMNPGMKPGEHVLLSVGDSGVGIPSEVLEHIFEPFFTTKPQGKGTGLGMSMVYAFSQRSHGSVRVYSEIAVGTTVHIYLPRTKKKREDSMERPGILPGLPGGDETILIVDDEQDLVTLADDMLRILGYTTLAAKNGNEAVNILLDKNNAIDLLFTDVVMPGGINGFELAQQALLLNPDLKVLFTSGYIEKAVPKSGQFPFGSEILFKPYTELDLAIRIREILDDD